MFRFILKLSVCLFSLTVPILVHGQYADNTGKHNTANIYYQALSHIVEYERSQHISCDTVYLEQDGYLTTDSIITEIGPTKIIVLNYQELKRVLDKEKHIALHRLFALSYSNGEFSISCIPFGASFDKGKNNKLKHKHISLGNGGGYEVFFRFENNQFQFVRVKEWGI